MFENTVVAGEAGLLDGAKQGLNAASTEFDRAVVSVLDSGRLEWSGEASEARRAVLEVGVQVLHRINDAVLSVAGECASLARAVEAARQEIAAASVSAPTWPREPDPLADDADPFERRIHQQLEWRYQADLSDYHCEVGRLQERIDETQSDLQRARKVFAQGCLEATTHLFTTPGGVQWTWDRNLMARANTGLADAFETGNIQLINSQAQVAGSTYAVSTLTRGLWNAVTGTVQTAADMVVGAGNAVWDAFESIGTGFGIGRPVDPQPHFQGSDITVDPAYPLDGVNQAMTIAAEIAWGLALATGVKGVAVRLSPGRSELLSELAAAGLKHDPASVLRIGRDASGRIVFLESGGARAGLAHIVAEHADHFAARGVSLDEVPELVMNAVTRGRIVGYQGRGTDRPIYEILFGGRLQRVAVTVGSNGFIVGANPA